MTLTDDQVLEWALATTSELVRRHAPQQFAAYERHLGLVRQVLCNLLAVPPDRWNIEDAFPSATGLGAIGGVGEEGQYIEAFITISARIGWGFKADTFRTSEQVSTLVSTECNRVQLSKKSTDEIAEFFVRAANEAKLLLPACGEEPGVYNSTLSPTKRAIPPETLHQRLRGLAAKPSLASNLEYVVFINSAIGFGKGLAADRDVIDQLRSSKTGFVVFFDDAAGEILLGSTTLVGLNPETQHYLILALLLKDVGNRLTAAQLATRLGEVSVKLGRTASFSDPMITNLVFQLRNKHPKLRNLIESSGGYRIADRVTTCLLIRNGSALVK